ncbi:MAG: type II toxin-antitoxin system RelE/ParE family toxin [Proteobacteria bacterium]|nr:type II toxin-antitoxin system RelE/ParE family toxin [Pseudomonadota bacterium]
MAEIIWTQEAVRWLHDIHNYIAQDNPQAAAKVIGGIFEKAQILRHYPEIGQKYRVEPEGKSEFCNYRIVYLLRPLQVIDILGVFHDAMDIERYIS